MCVLKVIVQTCVNTQGQVKAIAVYVAAPQRAWLYFRFCVKHIFYVNSCIVYINWSWGTLHPRFPIFTFAFGLEISLASPCWMTLTILFRHTGMCVCVCVFCAYRLILCNRQYDAMNFTIESTYFCRVDLQFCRLIWKWKSCWTGLISGHSI